MFVYVQLLSGFKKPLVYRLPKELEHLDLINKCVLVPLRQKKVSAFVIAQSPKLREAAAFDIKEILGLKPFPDDQKFHSFVEKAAKLYFTTPLFFYQKLRQFIKKSNSKNNSFSQPYDEKSDSKILPTLTNEQASASKFISQALSCEAFSPIVLHGVTGSGKTEVYKAAISQAIADGKTAIFLLPEISLAIQFKHRLENDLNTIPILGFHSAAQASEKKAIWLALLKKKPIVIIGVHLPILLPIANLGLIIIDEEHEAGFEEKKHPKFNSKYLAILRAKIYKIPIVLGSATPSVQTLYHVQAHQWPLFKLTQRFMGTFPTVQTVLLPKEPKKRFSFWISRDLEFALKECLENKKQALIFLNRRGYSFFIQCKKCGTVAECPSCSVSLTSHQTINDTLCLKCHYCNYSRTMPESCNECKANKSPFLTKGIGTQQLVEILQKMLPFARIARADLDTTKKKNLWATTAADFEQGKIDILVGTKSITKGYHFPGVSLVGVIWGDLHAHLPIFNATEQCLQQLIQVAGRAGRELPHSKVIIQTMYDHDLFNFINESDYLRFAQQELQDREDCWYPPFCRLIQIEIKHKNPSQVEKDAKTITQFLQQQASSIPSKIKILGPTTPLIHKIQMIESRHIFVKTDQFNNAEKLISQALKIPLKSSIFVQLT